MLEKDCSSSLVWQSKEQQCMMLAGMFSSSMMMDDEECLFLPMIG